MHFAVLKNDIGSILMKSQATNHLFETPFGDFNLKRIPDNDKNLLAWNSADRYLLKHLFSLQEAGDIDLHKAKILILNDAFGALTVPLSQFSCDSYGDSFVSQEAIKKNSIYGTAMLDNINFLKSTETLTSQYDIVLFKEVKNQGFLQDEMLKIAQNITPNALVIGAFMAKNLQQNSIKILNKTIGDTQASLAWKKARLLFIKPKQHDQNTVEASQISTYTLEGGNETIYNLPNVFSKNKLDIGTRLFLQHLPQPEENEDNNYKSIIDLGCGNGVLALKMAQRFPEAKLTCVDESYMALASAKMTLEANVNVEHRDLNYIESNALLGFSENSTDLIVCNPPFHQQLVVSDSVAWQMLQHSKTVLKKGGELWIVGNRHLDYHVKLQKIFGNYKLIASNNKFVILTAFKN